MGKDFVAGFAALLALAGCRPEERSMPMMMQADARPAIDLAVPATVGTISFAVG
jgi:hypothetical protein